MSGDAGRDRISEALKRKHGGLEIEILARCDVLWSGWECDHGVVLCRVTSTGEVGLNVEGGVAHPGDRGPVAMLEERLGAYRLAIEETEALLAMAKKEQKP